MEEKRKFIKNQRKNLGKWNNFLIVSPGQAILRGNYSINDKHFKILSRGRQATASAAVGIAYAHTVEPRNWTANLIDRILDDGDKLFRISQAHYRVKDDVYMTSNLLEQQFFAGNYKYKLCINVGIIHGKVFSEDMDTPNLKQGLNVFLNNSNFGILTCQEHSVAIWTYQHCEYFYLDPAPVDEQGKRNYSGFACIIRVPDIEIIFKLFTQNLKYKNDFKYSIDKINVMKIEAINREKYNYENAHDIMTKKKVIQKFSDVNEMIINCTKNDKNINSEIKDTKIVQQPIRKIPLTIDMTNDTIEANFSQMPLVNQNIVDKRYTYNEIDVNIPSVFKTVLTDSEIKILHGWTHDASDFYKGKGEQAIANCVIAIAMKKMFPVRTWLRKTLDDILTIGDDIYTQVKAQKPNIKIMTAADLDDIRFKLGDIKLLIVVDLLTVIGTVISKDHTVLNMKQGLQEFFIHNTDGIFECSTTSVGIWIEDNYYYLFDSRSCDAVGLHTTILEDKKINGNKECKRRIRIGKCCVIRFTTLNSLYEHILKSFYPVNFQCRFTIRRVDIINDVPGIRDWYAFRPAIVGKSWILRGKINYYDEIFNEHSRGVQGLGIHVVVLVASKIIAPCNWSQHDINEVIIEGDAYYNWCMPSSGENEDDGKILSLKNLKKYLYFKKCKVLLDIKESCIIGILGKFIDDNLIILERKIRDFFKNYECGLLEINNSYFAMWKFEEKLADKNTEVGYYLFYDKPLANVLQIETESNNTEDFPCVLRFLNLHEIVVTLKEYLEIKDEYMKTNFFIHEIKIASMSEPLTDEEIEIDKTIPIKPELRAYISMGENGAYLNGSFNQANEILFKTETRNTQQAANAIVTLSMTKLFDPHLWYTEVLDDILKIGDILNIKSLKNLMDNGEDNTKNVRNYLLPNEINQHFFLGINQITISIEEETITGELNELIKNLEEFFSSNKMGVFRQQQIMLAVWREQNIYFTMDPIGQKTKKATTYWYTDLSSIADILLNCSQKSEGDFIIDSITIENNYLISKYIEEDFNAENKWYNFQKIYEGVWKLDCNINMTNEIFLKENQGNQSAAISIMAIVFSKAYEPQYWTTEILDEITITGDILHSRSVTRIGKNKSFQPNEIISEFFIANRRINLNIQDCMENGTINGSSKILDIICGISNFLKKFSSGCVTLSGYYNLAIWTYGNYFYYYEPGYSLMRFKSATELAKKIVIDSEPDTEYVICSVDVLDWNKISLSIYDPSSAMTPSNLPPINAYFRLPGRARAILRGFTHQSSEIFSENVRGRQASANCIICLAMSLIKNPTTWTRKTLDEILAIGINLYHESLRCITKTNRLEPTDIIRFFHIGVNVFVVDVDKTITGIITNPYKKSEKEEKNEKNVLNKKFENIKKGIKLKRVSPSPRTYILLKEGLEIFFKSNNAGILIVGRYMAAIWIYKGIYFMYDPKARNHEGLNYDDNNGKSCVVWFACIQPLYDLLYININDDEINNKFIIYRIIIKTIFIRSLPCPVGYKIMNKSYSTASNEMMHLSSTEILQGYPLNMNLETLFERVDDESSVLLGSSHMSASQFPVENRGLQSSAIAAASIVVATLHPPSTWTSNLINETLKYGNNLHAECARLFQSGPRTLSLNELLEVFVIGDVRVRIRFHKNVSAGITLEHDLTNALEFFFANNSFGIMHTTNYAISLIQHCGKFYFLDPSERNGLKDSFESAACLVECENTAKLARIIVQVCSFKEPVAYTLNVVQILDLHFFIQ